MKKIGKGKHDSEMPSQGESTASSLKEMWMTKL